MRRGPITAEPAKAVATTIDLAGDWELREALGLTWQWYAGSPATGLNNTADAAAAVRRAPGWLPATVPGSVIADLHRAGELPDPYRGRNSRAAEWVAERSWVYRRRIDLPRRAPGERVVLELDGVDPAATVLLSAGRDAATEVGHVGGIFRRHRIDLTDAAGEGAHTLAVVVHPAPASEPQVGRTELVRVHAPRMGYGWDFCPRLRHQGIWKGARIRIGRSLLDEVSVRTELDASRGSGTVVVSASADGPVTVEVLDGEVVVATSAAAVAARRGDAGGRELRLPVPSPELWWPNGLGEQRLYTVRVSTEDDARELTVGFRSIEFEAATDAPPGALPYTAVVNGERTPLVGWNWVPADALYGSVPTGRVEHLIDLAARSGARILRVWGGGLIETEEFFDACDRAGLLVWQEFSQSSSGMQSAPARDDEFVEYLRAEAEAIVPGLVHHPSLAMFGGGNELAGSGLHGGDVPLDEERSPALAALREVVERMAPGRHWVPTSPSGPAFHNRLEAIRADPEAQHDVHGPWEHQGLVAHHELYNAGTSLAHTEFGVEGMTNLRSLEALVPVGDRWPADRSNPVYRHLGEWWNNAELVQESFAGRLDTLERMQRASQLLQATGLAYAVEADRRRWPRCSMVLPWQLNESYPNAWCTSSVDYRGDAKPAYHAVGRAFRPRRATVRADRSVFAGERMMRAEVWVWSEQPVPSGSRLIARLRSATGAVLASEEWTLPAVGDPMRAGALETSTPDAPIVAWELDWRTGDGTLLDHEVVLAATGENWSALLDLPRAELEVEVTEITADDVAGETDARRGTGGPGRGRRIRIRHRSGPLVVGLRLVDARPAAAEGWAVIDGDPRPLLPGEEREFAVHWRGTEPGPLRLESWNTETLEIA